MLIIENPYGTNTLSLYVYFTSKEAVSVSYEISVQDTSIPNFEGNQLVNQIIVQNMNFRS